METLNLDGLKSRHKLPFLKVLSVLAVPVEDKAGKCPLLFYASAVRTGQTGHYWQNCRLR